MNALSPGLSQCHRVADRVESAAEILGSSWSGYYPISQACQKFRRDCERLASNRGFSGITIAFVGQKKAGKSTLIGMLLESKEKRQRLRAGQTSIESTAKPTWVASKAPDLFESTNEEFIPCHESELASLGFAYALLDVPGSNESNAARQELAIQALDSAVVKVLVVDRSQIESKDILAYLDATASAPIIPIINRIRPGADFTDLADWEDRLRQRYSNVLARIELPDWDIAGESGKTRIQAKQELIERLSEAAAGCSAQTLADPQHKRKLLMFERRISEIACEHLPRTEEALKGLQKSMFGIPAQAVEALLGSDRLMIANIRLSFRSLLLERTPSLLFPWRLALGLANLVHGATDRLPLAAAGSIPSLVTVALAAAKNTKQSREFNEESVAGLRTRVNSVIKEMAGTKLREVDDALKRDLKVSSTITLQTGATSTVNLRGLETLQIRSTELFQDIIERYAPGSVAAWLVGLAGVGIFWSIFGWPAYGLYQDFILAAAEVLSRQKSTLATFPAGTTSMLLTSAVLALLPMGLFLLCILTLLTCRGRALTCLDELKSAHQAELKRLTNSGEMGVEISEPKIDACRELLIRDFTCKHHQEECQKQ